jgi:signal transduction histidine kinase
MTAQVQSGLSDIHVLFIGGSAPWVVAHREALAGAGLTVRHRQSHERFPPLIPGQILQVIVADVDEVPDRIRTVRLRLPGDALAPMVLLEAARLVDESPGATRLGAIVLPAELPSAALVGHVVAFGAWQRRAQALESHAGDLATELRARARRQAEVRRQIEILEHELRTPLGAVLGFAANLRDGIDGPITAEQRNSIERVLSAARSVHSVVEQTFSETNRQLAEPIEVPALPGAPVRRLQRARVELGELVTETVAMFQLDGERRGVAITAVIEQNVYCWGEAAKLMEALSNLLSNALKYTPAGGAIVCTLGLSEPPSRSGARREARFVVADTGPGIPPADRERIFDAGVRLDPTPGRPGKGLGLSIVRDLIELHQGRVVVAEDPGGGGRFVVTMPLDLRQRQRPGVLLVRDHARVEELLRELADVDPGRLEAVPQPSVSTPTARSCPIVAIVPRDRSETLNQLVDRILHAAGLTEDRQARPGME